MMFRQYDDVVGIPDLMRMLKIGKNSAYTLVKNGAIQSIRIGKVHKIPKKNIIKYLQSKG